MKKYSSVLLAGALVALTATGAAAQEREHGNHGSERSREVRQNENRGNGQYQNGQWQNGQQGRDDRGDDRDEGRDRRRANRGTDQYGNPIGVIRTTDANGNVVYGNQVPGRYGVGALQRDVNGNPIYTTGQVDQYGRPIYSSGVNNGMVRDKRGKWKKAKHRHDRD